MVVRVETRGGAEKREISEESIQTISDLKRRLCEEDPSSVMLSFKGKILNDSTPISTLGEDVTFVIEKDIEFSKIAPSGKCASAQDSAAPTKTYMSKVNGGMMLLREDEVFFKQGRPYLITKKTKKVKFRDIVRYLKNSISKAHVVQTLLLMFIVATGNYPLMAIIFTVNALRFVSHFALKYRVWEKTTNHLTYSVFMFLASLLAIDHEKFHRKKTVN